MATPAGHVDTGVKVRGRRVYRGARGGLYSLTATGKKAVLGKQDLVEFKRRQNNPDLLTRLPVDLIGRIAGQLSRANAASLARASRSTRDAVGPWLAADKASVKGAWKALFQSLRPVIAVRPTQALTVGQAIGPLTVTNVRAVRKHENPQTGRDDAGGMDSPNRLAEGSRRIDGAWYTITAWLPYLSNDVAEGMTTITIAKKQRMQSGTYFVNVATIFAFESIAEVSARNSPRVVREAAQELGFRLST